MTLRTALGELGGSERHRFTATVKRFGKRPGWNGPEETILLVGVRHLATDKVVCDHLWFKAGSWCASLNPGDHFEFDARVDSYTKGYQGRKAEETGEAWYETDWRLMRPTKVVKLAMEDASEQPAAGTNDNPKEA